MLFSSDHVYVRAQGHNADVGLSDFGQNHLGRITAIELPPVGHLLYRGELLATIEAIKVTVELSAPVSGVVAAVNDQLQADPWRVNTDPYGSGWLLRVQLTDLLELNHLLDEQTYAARATWDPHIR
jgi:glycine cleavage system H protein